TKDMMKSSVIAVSGFLSLTFVLPAVSQPDEQAPREIDEQAIIELFQDLQLQDDVGDDPRDQIEQQRRQIEEIRRQLAGLQVDGPVRIEPGFPGEEVDLNAKPIDNPWANRPRAEVIAGLDHAEFAVRESAEAHLLTDNTLGRAALETLIKEAKSPEQRQRLLRLAEHHVLRELRERDFGLGAEQPADVDLQEPNVFGGRAAARPAAVGYSYDPVLARDNPQAELPGVEVIATMPGFPGHAHLRTGDIIVQINGQSLSIHHREHDITNWVRWQISSKQAGEKISFTVLRNGELLAIDMICAEGKALDHMYSTNAFAAASRREPYRSAWLDARDELAALMPKAKALTPVVQAAD
ncbi:MAG: PDZ domain-containing protein, partial [Planctomycetota bacterium]